MRGSGRFIVAWYRFSIRVDHCIGFIPGAAGFRFWPFRVAKRSLVEIVLWMLNG